MTQELIDKLIAHYTKAIAALQKLETEDMDTVRHLLREMNIQRGICLCALWKFGTDIYSDEWIKGQDTGDSREAELFWFKTPSSAENREEAIKLMQLRIDRMKTFQ